jgi:hypothetical protein
MGGQGIQRPCRLCIGPPCRVGRAARTAGEDPQQHRRRRPGSRCRAARGGGQRRIPGSHGSSSRRHGGTAVRVCGLQPHPSSVLPGSRLVRIRRARHVRDLPNQPRRPGPLRRSTIVARSLRRRQHAPRHRSMARHHRSKGVRSSPSRVTPARVPRAPRLGLLARAEHTPRLRPHVCGGYPEESPKPPLVPRRCRMHRRVRPTRALGVAALPRHHTAVPSHVARTALLPCCTMWSGSSPLRPESTA